MQTEQKLEERLITAELIANAARKVVSPLFKSSNLSIDYKEALSPIVTQADRDSEKAMREIIESQHPNDTIVGEEFGVKNGDSGFSWILDPIDGTIAFSVGKPVFGTLIGLAYQNDLVLGVIEQPVLKERFIGHKGSATLNGKEIKASDKEELKYCSLGLTAPLRQEQIKEKMDSLMAQVHVTSYGGDCYNYALLASGHLDIVVEKGLALHDFAALVPLIEGAGGVITDWSGNSIDKNSNGEVLACANKVIHAKVSSVLFS